MRSSGDFFASLKDPQSCRRRPCNGDRRELRRFAPWSPRSRGVPCNSKFYKRNYIRSMIFFICLTCRSQASLMLQAIQIKKQQPIGCCFVYKIWLRKEGDSNPRYGDPYVSLANWWFQPLTHPSERECKDSKLIWYTKIFRYKKLLFFISFFSKSDIERFLVGTGITSMFCVGSGIIVCTWKIGFCTKI